MKKVLSIELDPEFGGVYVPGKLYIDHETLEHEIDRDFWPWEDIEIMQSIGLLDKNVKEIYKGDIIHITVGTPIKNPQNGEYYMDFHNDTVNYEIIGNMYENSNLLNNKNTTKTD